MKPKQLANKLYRNKSKMRIFKRDNEKLTSIEPKLLKTITEVPPNSDEGLFKNQGNSTVYVAMYPKFN